VPRTLSAGPRPAFSIGTMRRPPVSCGTAGWLAPNALRCPVESSIGTTRGAESWCSASRASERPFRQISRTITAAATPTENDVQCRRLHCARVVTVLARRGCRRDEVGSGRGRREELGCPGACFFDVDGVAARLAVPGVKSPKPGEAEDHNLEGRAQRCSLHLLERHRGAALEAKRHALHDEPSCLHRSGSSRTVVSSSSSLASSCFRPTKDRTLEDAG
jgi:hypothetical protein